ncbi:MAG: T9SS type A sorting domain-containing protein [Saprospiraceae bacterium]|nr:T9SS type A sorting domain-containing protein [Saprospiraceae bacterium]
MVSNGCFFSNSGEIDKNNIPAGIYLLMINENYSQTFKFIIN